ncbi:MAG TPA: PAS domain-containing protein [Candidatus Eisenbacteria bacterium]|nr:PAS domain-containing protein [Candidatus Eisenbacteria bacterium]
MSFLDAKAFLLALLEHSVDGVLAIDTQGTVLVWNAALENMFGKPRADAIGQPLFDVLEFLGETGGDWSIRETMSGKTCRTEEQPFFLPETGREGWYQATYAPLCNADGELVGVLALIRDVSDNRRKLEGALADARKREESLKLQLRRRDTPLSSPALPAPPTQNPVKPRSMPDARLPSWLEQGPDQALPPALRSSTASPMPRDPESAPANRASLPPFLGSHEPSPGSSPNPAVEAGPAEFGGDSPIFDADAAFSYVGDPGVLEDLIQGFIVSLPEFVREMDHAVGRHDISAVLEHAEDVRKAVTTLGGVRATRIAVRLEAVAAEGKQEGVERTWWRLRRELAVFRETLRNHRKAA